jgi:hypothetical protein
MTEYPLSYAPAGVGSSPEVAARTETYLEAGRRGKNTWWRYLLGVVFVVFMWFVVGGRASLLLGNVLGISPGQIATDPSAAGPIAGYLVSSASFPVFLLGSVLAVTFLHRRSPFTLVTGRRSINWGRVGTGLGVWFALAVVASLVGFLRVLSGAEPRGLRARPQPHPVSGNRGDLLRGGLRAIQETYQEGPLGCPLLTRWVSWAEQSLPETTGGRCRT